MDWSRHLKRIVRRRQVHPVCDTSHESLPALDSSPQTVPPKSSAVNSYVAQAGHASDRQPKIAPQAETKNEPKDESHVASRIEAAPPPSKPQETVGPTIFFSVGEPSGDLHAANLMRAIRTRQPSARFVGYGGPEMAKVGCELHADLTALAVMWILRVLLNLHQFLKLLADADRYFATSRPDAVVLVDYPGFNWWIARRAKARGIPVYYYCPPQIWAWAGWRIGKMRRLVDHVLCTLPFEARWFRERGCRAEFVGHPYFDEVRRHAYDTGFLEQESKKSGPLVAILPGSRTQEVEHNLKWFLAAARLVKRQVPTVRFAIAAHKPHQADFARRRIDDEKLDAELDIEVFVQRTPELMSVADCCMAVSGSVSLELLHHTKPTVILYWIRHSAHVVQSYFLKSKYITLVNLLAADANSTSGRDAPAPEAALFPEYLTWKDVTAEIADHVIRWLTDPNERARRVARLDQLKAAVSHGGASKRTAEYILATLAPARAPIPRPHYLPGMRVASGGYDDACQLPTAPNG